MLAVNQRIVLRDYLDQQAIMGAETGHSRELVRLYQALRDPYHDDPDQDDLASPRLCASSGHLLLPASGARPKTRLGGRPSGGEGPRACAAYASH
ncbi:MAG: hypothetical protein GPOALKHO_000611 [Sodalis sp.]|uniref:hypothetical protein n=1 Tax=Sodalis sp. (in: enterobacteria) TaxID=1898979 RepID=UPI0038735E8F|nr:MAG: hypothetical protein GPOALKHO_000611 [Sodalis sp.]